MTPAATAVDTQITYDLPIHYIVSVSGLIIGRPVSSFIDAV